MGSSQKPNKSIIIASIASPQSAAFQDSPIFNYINSLSPIKAVKGSSVIQVFPGAGFNSPPLVFTSPRIHTNRHYIDLKSSTCHASSHPELSGEDDIRRLSEISSLKNSEDALCKMTDSMIPEGSIESYDIEEENMLADHEHEGNLRSRAKPVENDGSCSKQYDQRVTHHMQPVFGYKDCGKRIGLGVADEPIATLMERYSKVGQSQLGKRRRLQFETAQEKIVEEDHNSSNTTATSEVLESSLSRNIKNSSVNVSKPSGIGLHLNSIVNAMPLIYPSSGGKNSMSISSQLQDNMQSPSNSSNSNLVENVSARSEEYTHETPHSNSKSMMMLESQEMFDQLEQAEIVDEVSKSNPKKKRKKTDNSGDGCKRCNCKKTKCLKLYCDCFAAGIYCAGPCSCQGCFNRPEYEETVLKTRQQIESRNPLAFAPKIVPRPTQPPRIQTVEDGHHVTHLSGRHKRGCNCKKSMCLKKYCECYQANVGCSDGCRCEGCQNIYGTRGVSAMVRETGMEGINENLNDSFDDMLKVGSRSFLAEIHKPHNLTPETPSIQYSNHGKDVSKARVFPGRYVPSPESECTFYPYYVKDSAPEKVLVDQESYPNVEFIDEFSPSISSRAQLLPSSGMSFSSLGLCGTSVTPVTLFGGTKPSFDIIDYDTPKILKESSCIPSNKVIGTSPNKKRISPPRIRLHELGSTSLKSGRKFILKAVPSFPPLTPCTNSKDNTAQSSNPPPPRDNTL